ncbi:MAG: hypothetical protein DCF21_13300 [Leptolyngbya sp.]|jgi:HEPN domain-containing protein|uniref:HEPN domain-containing protein n=1 Tax=Shackletoniella antarctica TaxID=268115 RepID=A0A2W4VU16_9CYAN|nr:MAG: hypothetical protein DCF17_18140 [Shackletoniella antarctica]PZV14082.1 MAG: hypothetical protein DCF21_13300 [Leptolyngbya sp.]
MVDAKQVEVEKWLTISRRDLQAARALLKELLLENVVYHCEPEEEDAQQAIELAASILDFVTQKLP